MNTREQNTNLAYQIGLCRIALVVDQMYHHMRSHHSLAKFLPPAALPDQRARLTYFWWIVLGGKELRDVALDLLPGELRSAATPNLLHEWLGLFRQTARPIIGEGYTRAWLAIAEDLAQRLLVSPHDPKQNAA